MAPQEQTEISNWHVLRSAVHLFRGRFPQLFFIVVLPTSISYALWYVVAGRRFNVYASRIDFLWWDPYDSWRNIGFFISWLLSAIAFAAVCSCLGNHELQSGTGVMESYRAVMRRLLLIMAVAVLAYLPTYAVFYILGLTNPARTFMNIFRLVPSDHFAGIFLELCGLALLELAFLAAIGRLIFAVSELISEPQVSLSYAFRKALRQQDYGIFFFSVLVAVSAASNTAGWMRDTFLDFSVNRNALNQTMYPWANAILSIIVSAALQGFLFTVLALAGSGAKITQENYQAAAAR